jgi:CO dehydrogenase/acetyl-CoA synthase epsilon subunit
VANGEIDRYKAHVVTNLNGFSQIERIDYNETFAPIARYSLIRSC